MPGLSKSRYWFWGLGAALLISLFFSVFAYYYLLSPRSTFRWDESHLSSYGIMLAYRIKAGDWPGFWELSNRFVVGWPFFHSWLVSAFLLIFGPTFTAARLSSLFLFFFSVPLVYLISSRKNSGQSILIGVLAALFFASSPMVLAYVTVSMIESLGLFLSLLVFWCYFQGRRSRRNRYYFLVGIFTAFLFLSKYQYGLFMGGSLFIAWVWQCAILKKIEWKTAAWMLGGFCLIIGFWLFNSFTTFKIRGFLHTLQESGTHKHAAFTPLESRLHWLRSILGKHCPSPFLFPFLLGSFIYGIIKYRKNAYSLIFIFPAVNLLLMAFTRNKQDRYYILAMPYLFILASDFLIAIGISIKNKVGRWMYISLLLLLFVSELYKFPLLYRQISNRLPGMRVTWIENKVDYSIFFGLFSVPKIFLQPDFMLNSDADYSSPVHTMQDVWDYIYSTVDRRGSICCLAYHQKLSPHMLRWYSYTYRIPVFTSWEPRARYFATFKIIPSSVYYTTEGKSYSEGRIKKWNNTLAGLAREGKIKLVAEKTFQDIGIIVTVFEKTGRFR